MGRGLWADEGIEVSLLTITNVCDSSTGMVKGKEIQVVFEVGSLRKEGV